MKQKHEAVPDAESSAEKKSLKEIGESRRETVATAAKTVIEKSKGVWGGLKNKLASLADYALSSPEAVGRAGVATGKATVEGAKAAGRGAVKAGEAGLEAGKAAGRAGVKGAEIAAGAGVLAGKAAFEGARYVGGKAQEQGGKMKAGIENAMINASDRYEEFEAGVKARGQEAYQTLRMKGSEAKGKLYEFINKQKLKKLEREESQKTQALEEYQRKAAQMSESLERIRAKKMELLGSSEEQPEEFEAMEAAA